MNVVTVTSTYTVAAGVDCVFANATTTGFTVNLPDPAPNTGRQLIVRRTDNVLANLVRVMGTIEGTANAQRPLYAGTNGQATVVSDGATWRMLDYTAVPYIKNMWVAKNGDDTNDGYSPNRPKRTIMAAISILGPAGGHANIHIDGGTYTEKVVLGNHRIHLWGSPGSLNVGTQIKAPADEDAIVIGFAGCGLHNLSVTGAGGTWNKRGVVVLAAGQGAVLDSVSCFNATNTIPVGPDPGLGGTAFHIENTEHVVATNLTAQEFRVGLHIMDTGSGNSEHTFRKLFTSRCWQDIRIEGVCGNFTFESCKGVNPLGTADYAYQVDIDCENSSFINCDWTEGGANRAARITGNNNTLINCVNAPNTKLYIDGNKNVLINHYAQNQVFLNGAWNVINGIQKTASGAVVINGQHNEIKRHHMQGANADNQIGVTNNGLGTFVEGVRRGSGAPTTGYGWRAGDIIWNAAPTVGQPTGWICTVGAAGPPEPQGGQWAPLPALP